MSASAVSLHPRRKQGLRQLIHIVAVILVATFLAEGSRSLVYRFVGQVGGPLNVNVGTVSGARVKPGTTTTFGIFLHNDTDAVATLDSVRLIELDPGLRIVGLGVTSTEEGGIGTVRGYPPGGRLVEPLRGTPIANTRTHSAQILIGVVADRPGRYDVAGIEVSYHVGSQRYRAVILQGLQVCATSPTVHPGCNSIGEITRAQEAFRSLLFPGQN